MPQENAKLMAAIHKLEIKMGEELTPIKVSMEAILLFMQTQGTTNQDTTKKIDDLNDRLAKVVGNQIRFRAYITVAGGLGLAFITGFIDFAMGLMG